LKNSLGIFYEWKNDKVTESSIPEMLEEIIINYKKETEKEATLSSVPATPGSWLRKHERQPVMLDEYRSLVGKIMYNTTKLAPELSNAARELASHLSNPVEDHLIKLGKCVGYLRYGNKLKLIYRKPDELRSISTADSNYAQDPNDRKIISGRIKTVGGMLSKNK
jgi:hypothetical protein